MPAFKFPGFLRRRRGERAGRGLRRYRRHRLSGRVSNDCTCPAPQATSTATATPTPTATVTPTPEPTPVCGNDVVEGSEECDGAATGTPCDGECDTDCTCPTGPPCGTTFPACLGDCPAGQTCTHGTSACTCETPSTDACGTTFPSCNGACPPGLGCAFETLVTSQCGCVPLDEIRVRTAVSPRAVAYVPTGRRASIRRTFGCACRPGP